MRPFNALVFDENVPPTATNISPMYTSSTFNDLLGRFDQIAIQYIAETISGNPWIHVQLQHSADGRVWINKNSTAEIYSIVDTNPIGCGYDLGTIPSLGLARLEIYLVNGTPSCHLKLYVTGRGRNH